MSKDGLSFLILLIAFVVVFLGTYPQDPVKVDPIYHKSDLVSPIVSGWQLKVLVFISETWPFSRQFFKSVYASSEFGLISAFGQKLDVVPTFDPLVRVQEKGSPVEIDLKSIPNSPKPKGFQFQSVSDFARAYREGKQTPVEVCEQLIENIIQLNSQMSIFVAYNIPDILEQAKASHARFLSEKPLSIFDGVPIAVKDELDVNGYKTYAGTTFLGDRDGVKYYDATVVAKLRSLGAIVVGKTNMYEPFGSFPLYVFSNINEVGVGTTGANYHWGMPRNAYNTTRYTGGSSAGSGSVIGTGITPIAIGADGGGSVRIPSAFNGIVGLKATFGRVSEHGAFPICWSIAHIGPMGATVEDTALLYLGMQGADETDPITQSQPHNNFKISDMKYKIPSNLKIGIFKAWNEDAEPNILNAFNDLVKKLQSEGATVVPIEIPYLVPMNKAHTATIGSEMRTALNEYLRVNGTKFSLETRASFAFFAGLAATEYIDAAKIRTFAMSVMKEIFSRVDVIATPATAVVAPFIPPESLDSGYSDVKTLGNIMKFMQIGNFVGNPAIVQPIAYDENNLPIAIQFMANHWNEKILFEVASGVETLIQRKKPQVYVSYKI